MIETRRDSGGSSIAQDTVAGIFLRDRKFLVERRSIKDDSDPGLVAIPGGHLEKRESLHNAFKREMKEELGITISKITPVYVGLHKTTTGELDRIHYYRVDDWKGRIIAREAEKVYWESDPRKLSAKTDRKALRRILQMQHKNP